MPNLKNAVKKVKVIAKKSESNNTFKASMRTAIKKVEKAVEAKDKANTSELLKDAIKKLISCVKGVIHKNTGARYKARLTKS